MGLAASQCRLLLLTARLSDTEYRAQMISQRRMALAMQTEQIATEYSRALNNRILKFAHTVDGNENQILKSPLTYDELTAENGKLIGEYRVLDTQGRIIVPSLDQIPGIRSVTNINGEKQYFHPIEPTEEMVKEFCKLVVSNSNQEESGLDELLATDDWTPAITQQAWTLINADTALRTAFNNKYAETAPAISKEELGGTIIGSDGQKYIVMPGIKNMEFFQNCIRTGAVQIQQYQENFSENNGWANYNPLASDIIYDDLATWDDAAAQAEYESKTAMIQSQDKMLEIELKQVESQHQAAQTEYDSVKKVIDKNIERSFKTFG